MKKYIKNVFHNSNILTRKAKVKKKKKKGAKTYHNLIKLRIFPNTNGW